MTRKETAVEKFDCPYCKATPGNPCINQGASLKATKRPHPERMDEARKAGY